MSSDDALVTRSVREFIASVASAAEPVPAGGSVAALTGAASAALLALVAELLDRKRVAGASELLARARTVQDRLVGLIDADAAAYRAYLAARRSPRAELQAALDRTTQTPLDIATACREVVTLSRDVERRTTGQLLGDVRTARGLARAAVMAAVDIAEQNVVLQTDPAAQARLQAEIARLTAQSSAG